jgi:hypothetical protein
VIAIPGSAYHYSGGGYEITEALMQDAAGKPFAQLMQARARPGWNDPELRRLTVPPSRFCHKAPLH